MPATDKKDMFCQGHILVGGRIPRQVFNLLSLVSLYLHKSRARIFRELIIRFLGDQINQRPVVELVRLLAERGFQGWKDACREERRNIPFISYKGRLKRSLQKKHIAQEHILLILKEATQNYEKDKRCWKTKQAGTQARSSRTK
jgi:hypothetical protein